jgi:hypothetical protein
MFDFRTLLGLLLLALVGLVGLQGHSATLQVGPPSDKKVEPEKKDPPKRKILPWREVKEVKEQTLRKPIGYWHAPSKDFVTTGWETFAGKAQVGGTTSPDGAEEIQIDLPPELHLKNTGGTDKAGLCVWCSGNHAAYWQHVHACEAIFTRMQREKGGGWPERVDQLLPKFAAELGLPTPRYIQVQNRDLAILRLATRTGRMPGVTYNFSPTGRYQGRIAHMVSLVHCTDRWCTILDNNHPKTYEWMDPATFLKVYTYGGNGWAWIFEDPGPPPPPHNAS